MTDGHETEVPHHFEVGEELIKHDTSRWEVTKRLVDVDNDTVIYQLRESDVGPSNFTELMPEEDVIDLFEKPDAAEPELVTDGGRSESEVSHEGPGTGDGERIIVEYTDPIQDYDYRIVEEVNPGPKYGVEVDVVTYARPRKGDEWEHTQTGHARDLEVLPDER